MTMNFDHTEFPLGELLERKRRTVSVVLPAQEEADTVGLIVKRIGALEGLVDQVLVVDADSRDGTAAIAADAGAEVLQQASLVPEMGPVLGKGDAMWRALAAARCDIVVYIDADTRNFSASLVTGLLGPLLTDRGARFCKATYDRPYTSGDHEVANGGGRVSQLTARPLLAAFYPELADLTQPLAGEVAGARALFERIPFATGYSVETAMLLELYREIGPAAIAQVHLGERRNAHQSLDALRPMAESVLNAVTDRLQREGRLIGAPPAPPLVYRPPYASLGGKQQSRQGALQLRGTGGSTAPAP